jgi:hypothetical protein
MVNVCGILLMDHLKKWFCSKHRKGKIDDQDYILTGTLIYELIRLYLTHGTCTPPKKSKIKYKKNNSWNISKTELLAVQTFSKIRRP